MTLMLRARDLGPRKCEVTTGCEVGWSVSSMWGSPVGQTDGHQDQTKAIRCQEELGGPER